MFSDEWSKLISDRKEELGKRVGNDFLESLGAQVNFEVTGEKVKAASKLHVSEIKSEKHSRTKQKFKTIFNWIKQIAFTHNTHEVC